jgi:hypothetical protein
MALAAALNSTAMIHDQSPPMTLWVEACMTAVYVQNRSPHQILKNITPEEAFTKVKPEIGHFRIFGFPVYLHVPKEKRSKLEPSRRKGTFVGYSESSKAYRIYIPGQRQIEVSKDVTFEEEVAFQKSREAQMEINGEIIPSPHSVVQRETDIYQMSQQHQLIQQIRLPQVMYPKLDIKDLLGHVKL